VTYQDQDYESLFDSIYKATVDTVQGFRKTPPKEGTPEHTLWMNLEATLATYEETKRKRKP
jgi:hypothetical protein